MHGPAGCGRRELLAVERIDAGSASPAEALQRAGRTACLSHESAARALGIELLEAGSDRLTVPRARSRLTIPGWAIVRADVPARDVDACNGLRCTRPARTIGDLSRVTSLPEAVVAADSALRARLVSAQELRACLGAARGRGAAAPRAVAAQLDPGAGSVLETLVRLVLTEAGWRPVSQYVIRDAWGHFVARVDFCWPAQRLVVEADGFTYHASRADFRRDRARLNALERLGWRVLRFGWEDVRNRRAYIVSAVRDCLAVAA